MLFSIALILLLSYFISAICKRLHIPSLLGMIIVGIILGPHLLNLISPSILNISSELRRIALIIILIRAGLTLDIEDLKQVGRPALLMCFVPALFEIIGMVMIAPLLLHVSLIEAAIIGSVVAAVSPAVIVPKMINLIEQGYGIKKSIPQLILAGASVDDVFVIVLFTSFVALGNGENVSYLNFVNIPISIILGIFIGSLIGYLLFRYFKKVHLRDTIKVMIILSIAFIVVTIEDNISLSISFSSLIAIMFMATMFNKHDLSLTKRLSNKFNKLWIGFEILLFVLVGATVDLNYLSNNLIIAIIIVLSVLCFRMLGVFMCLINTSLNYKERLFCMIAYCPKATVQAAIGTIPLTMGLQCGNIVLTIAITAILITAPLGAVAIDLSYQKLLE